MGRVDDVFENENVGKCEIVKGFFFAIPVDIMDKTGSMFETCKEVLASIDSEKCLNVVHEGYWVFISGFLLWYEGDSDFFGWA